MLGTLKECQEKNLVSSKSQIQSISKSNKKLCRYNSISPRIFSMGDIVEARVSFVAVPVSGSNGKRFKLAMVLRSLALIDDTFTKVCHCFSFY
jgi:hypothetical protein